MTTCFDFNIFNSGLVGCEKPGSALQRAAKSCTDMASFYTKRCEQNLSNYTLIYYITFECCRYAQLKLDGRCLRTPHCSVPYQCVYVRKLREYQWRRNEDMTQAFKGSVRGRFDCGLSLFVCFMASPLLQPELAKAGWLNSLQRPCLRSGHTRGSRMAGFVELEVGFKVDIFFHQLGSVLFVTLILITLVFTSVVIARLLCLPRFF